MALSVGLSIIYHIQDLNDICYKYLNFLNDILQGPWATSLRDIIL